MNRKQKPKVYYDSKVDALWICVKQGREADAEEIAPGLTVEYDGKGGIIGFELLNASGMLAEVAKSHVWDQKYLQAA